MEEKREEENSFHILFITMTTEPLLFFFWRNLDKCKFKDSYVTYIFMVLGVVWNYHVYGSWANHQIRVDIFVCLCILKKNTFQWKKAYTSTFCFLENIHYLFYIPAMIITLTWLNINFAQKSKGKHISRKC